MTASVRRAVPADLDPVVALAAEYAVADGHAFEAACARRGIEPLLADDTRGVIWLAVEHDRPVGYAAVTWGWSIEVGGLDVVLDEIYTAERNRGIGTALLDHLVADCRARGVERIFLETERPNEGARRLYARHGFVADTSIWMSRELQ